MTKLTIDEQIIKICELKNKWYEEGREPIKENPGLRRALLGEYDIEEKE